MKTIPNTFLNGNKEIYAFQGFHLRLQVLLFITCLNVKIIHINIILDLVGFKDVELRLVIHISE